MIVIPGYGPSSESRPGPLADPSAAAAPGLAIAQIGRGLAAVGKTTGDISNTIQAAENAATVSAALRSLSESQAAFEQSLLTDHDHTNYGTRLESEVIGPARSLITPDMPPAVRSELTERVANWESDMRIRTGKAASSTAISRARHELELTRDAFVENGDLDGYLSHLNNQEWMTPEERQLEATHATRLADSRRVEMDIQRNPASWLEANPEPPDNPAKLAQWNARRRLATGELRRITGDAIDEANDLIVQGKLSPEMVESHFGDLRPTVREQIKEQAERWQNGQIQAELNDPEFQTTLTGQIHQQILDYDPEQSGTFDEDLVSIENSMASLADGPAKDMFAEMLKTKREGKRLEVKTVRQAAIRRLNEARTKGTFGDTSKPEPERLTIGDFADSGFFKDLDKIHSTGIDYETAKDIAGKPTLKERMDLFRSAYQERDREADVWADPYTLKFAEAIRDGKGVSSTFDTRISHDDELDFDHRIAAEADAYGSALQDLSEWLSLTPSPTLDQVTEKLQSIGVQADRQTLRSSIIPQRPESVTPQGTGMLPSETSSIGTFGGQPILPAGTPYRAARATVFGGPNDPNDNGKSAFGGTTGRGGKEGVAIPLAILQKTYPGKSKAWLGKNVQVRVTSSNGKTADLPLADLGTAEWVWKRDKRPVLDLTPGAVAKLGGTVRYTKSRKLSHPSGLGTVTFTLLPS